MYITPELLRRYNQAGPRYTSYPTALQFDGAFDADAYLRHLHLERENQKPLSVYMHLPFCESRCLYCACNATASPDHDKVSGPYLVRLVREMGLVAGAMRTRREVAQLHLGGGTPTYHSPAELNGLMGYFRSWFEFTPDAELSVEVDPRVTSEEHLAVLAEQGFRRISLGVQDLDPAVQQAIGRVQSIEETARVVEQARALGFTSVNIDLIYGLPLQTLTSFRRTVQAVIELNADRAAIYSFAWVPSKQPHQKALNPATFPDAETKFQLLAQAREQFAEAGYEMIGIDHVARRHDELAQAQGRGTLHRNFMGYTVQRTESMIGLGPSSIGYVGGAYVQNTRRLSEYLRAIDEGHLPVARGLELSEDDRLRARVIEEIMCNGQVSGELLKARPGLSFGQHFAAELAAVKERCPELALVQEDSIELTELGRTFARNVAMCFDAYLPRSGDEAGLYSQTV
jgi:oxygen-independent coproporphyrinogen-3 oxidase